MMHAGKHGTSDTVDARHGIDETRRRFGHDSVTLLKGFLGQKRLWLAPCLAREKT
jgi:hypothetical protein